MSFNVFPFGFGPFLLALAASLWITNGTFTTFARFANALLAVMVTLRRMRYASHGIFNGGMLLVLVLAVLIRSSMRCV